MGLQEFWFILVAVLFIGAAQGPINPASAHVLAQRVPREWFGTPTHPGNVIGHWLCPQGNAIPVVAVASHDTASAVIASPLAATQAGGNASVTGGGL